MVKPTFVFVHGAWHSGSCWQPLSQVLNLHGYRCVAPDLPGVLRNKQDKASDPADDVACVRRAVSEELRSGNNVIVVCHSWGGIPGASALQGLDPVARQGDGHDTSVVGLAGISTFFLPAGTNIGNGRGPFASLDRGVSVPDGDTLVVKDPGPAHFFYHDIPREEGEKWAKTLHPHRIASIMADVTYAPYTKIPIHYLVCKQDRAISEGLQGYLVGQIASLGVDVRLEEVDAAHSPFLSQVNKTADFLRRCAGEQIPENGADQSM